MKHTIRAHKTFYNGVWFRSRLHARWAVFFDLAGWEWQYEPIALPGWTPDFYVSFLCGHSECPDGHSLLVEVKPYFSIEEFKGHPCMDYSYGSSDCDDNGIQKYIPAHASAAFGNDPSITYWEMGHGPGGGIFTIDFWVDDIDVLWKQAGNIVQFRPKGETNG